MKKIRNFSLITMLAFCSFAKAESGIESLSPELRTLLGKEMVALQTGMQSILPAYVSGDLAAVAETARKIENSFILKQQITKAQKQELGSKLPKAFIRMDKQFHENAAMLSHVAEQQHTELVGFYYSRLIEACMACHAEYATHRFPKLEGKSTHGKHLH